MKRERTCNRP